MKMKCIETVKFMDKEVYTKGQIYEAEEVYTDGELEGYNISGNGGIGYISADDKKMDNFEEVEVTYEIKAIYNGDVNNKFANVFEFNGEYFIHISDAHTEKEKIISYYKDAILYNKDWTLFEIDNGITKKLKRKHIEEALDKYIYN